MAPEPPFATATIPVILPAFTSEILALEILPSATKGASAVPVKSPANCIFPLIVVVASSIVEPITCAST